jgi:hypothetical protein
MRDISRRIERRIAQELQKETERNTSLPQIYLAVARSMFPALHREVVHFPHSVHMCAARRRKNGVYTRNENENDLYMTADQAER